MRPPKKSPDRRAIAARRNGRRGGRPVGEPSILARIYAADLAWLAPLGRSIAEAVRSVKPR